MKLISKSFDETIEIGYKLAKLLKPGSFLILNGDLASGKTSLTKGIGKALNIKQVINSPTFTILKVYEGDLKLYHIDAYRLENSDYDLGFEEFDDGIMVVEWPIYFKNYIPSNYLEINLKYIDENSREISFNPIGQYYKDILKEFENANTMP